MQKQRSHSWFFILCAMEGAVAMAALLSVPSEGGSISTARLALVSVLLMFCILWIYFGIRPPGGLNRVARPPFIIISALLSLTFSLLLFFLRYLNPERLLPIYERLSPLLWYLLILFVQVTFFLLTINNGLHLESLKQKETIYLASWTAFCSLIFMFLFIHLTRLGLTPDSAYWGEPGVAILGWQFALALIGGLCVLCFALYVRAHVLDIFLPIIIYFVTLAVCLSVPVSVLQNSFYMPISQPTFQPFPYSDSAYYDQMAESVLIGHPYLGVIPTRPLYIFLLIVLHLLFGENYLHILSGQTFVLAFIPVVLYFLGKKLHGRVAGVTVALFFIFRELTSLLISSNTRVTNTKMLLVDLPTLFLLLLSCLFAFRWFERRDWKSAFIAGGMFGLLLLLRTQSMLILPFIVLVAFLVFGWRNRSVYILTSVFVLGLVVTVVPWLTHNYLQTGEFVFDSASQYKVIASQYAYSGNLDTRNYDFEGRGLGSVLIGFALKDPKFVFGFIANHFLATQVNGLLALPLIEPYNGIFAPINMYWINWNGELAWYNVLLLILYLAIISLGFGSAWRRWRWMGLLPLVFSVGYALATAIGRFSSWRYDFPADWISYFYFGVGFAELLMQTALLFGAKGELAAAPSEPPDEPRMLSGSRKQIINGVVLAVVFALIGALPWMITKITSPRYTDQSPETLESKIVTISNAPTSGEIKTFVSQPGTFLQAGRLLYPRFFPRNMGLTSGKPSPAYAIRDYPRLGFLLLNQNSMPAVFQTKKTSGFVPQAADVIILGCQRKDYIEVRLMAVPDLDVIYMNTPLSDPCSP